MFELNGVLIRLSEVILIQFQPAENTITHSKDWISIRFKNSRQYSSFEASREQYDRLKEALLKEGGDA